MNTREIVLEMLLEITQKKEYSHQVIKNTLDKYNYLDTVDKAFMKRICDGTLERMIEIDYIIGQFSSVKINKMKPVIRNILRMAVYQILFMDSVPDSAACNEAVKLAQKKKFQNLKGFVNGVLRNIVRSKEAIVYPDQEKEPIKYLSIRFSMPEWLILFWKEQYGMKKTEHIIKGLFEQKPVTIRMGENLSENEIKEVKDEWEANGIVFEQHTYLPYAFKLRKVDGLNNLTHFCDGKYTVQDVSSMLIAEVSGIKSGDTVLDVCAAPGGKAIHFAQKLNGTGLVKARDISDTKVQYIEQNVERMQLENIEFKVEDATVTYEENKESADIVLADVPCSGLGIMGKKRDIKYNIEEEALTNIVSLQQQIVSNVSQYVKESGTFLYSTCTINQKENEEMVMWIQNNLPFQLVSIEEQLPEALKGNTGKKGYLQLFPGINDTDGFFLAKLKRI